MRSEMTQTDSMTTTATTTTTMDAALRAAVQQQAEAIEPLLNALTSAYRAEEYRMVLQHYDLLLACPALEALAQVAQDEGTALHALIEDEAQTLARDAAALLPPHPLPSLTAPAHDPLPRLLGLYRQVELGWGQALLAAMKHAPAEEEHHDEIVEDYERTFGTRSAYLRALRLPSETSLDTLTEYDLKEGRLVADVVLAALTKHPVQGGVDELTGLMDYLKLNHIALSLPLAETLEKAFVRCMKGDAAEAVFNRMIDAGLRPLSTRPFAMIFNTKTYKGPWTMLDYYDMMLDFGIAPEASTLRILRSRSNLKDFAWIHFTVLRKNYEAANVAATSGGATGSSFSASRKESSTVVTSQRNAENSTGGSATNRSAADTTNSNAEEDERARRDAPRHELHYYHDRVEQLARRRPETPLLEVLRLLPRSAVEGSQMMYYKFVLAAVLLRFCNGTTPLELLARPFTAEMAYQDLHPVHAASEAADNEESSATTVAKEAMSDEAVKETAAERAAAEASAATQPAISVTVGSRDALRRGSRGRGGIEDSDEDEDEAAGNEGDSHGANNEDLANHSSSSNAAAEPARLLATPVEEASYVLRAMADYGVVPVNATICHLARHLANKNHGMAIFEVVLQAAFATTQGAPSGVKPIRCGPLQLLMRSYIRRRLRHRVVQLMRQVIWQYYEYTTSAREEWGSEEWEGDGQNFAALVNMAIESGQADWGFGLLPLLLLLTRADSVALATRSRLLRFHDGGHHGHYRGTYHAVLNALEDCRWARAAILSHPTLMFERHERVGQGGGGEEAAAAEQPATSSSNGDTAAAAAVSKNDGAAAAGEEEPASTSVYSSGQRQEPSSHSNPRGLDASPTLFSYMAVALREMGFERAVMDWFKGQLRSARQAALGERNAQAAAK